MAVILDVQTPLSSFIDGGGTFDLEFERVVPCGNTEVVPFVWVRADDFDAFERYAKGLAVVAELEHLYERDDARLYRVDWTLEPDGLMSAIRDADATILSGRSDGEMLTLQLRFGDEERLSAFSRDCTERGVETTPLRIARPEHGDGGNGLTEEQLETIRVAYGLGYFDIPRGATLEQLAAELGVSDQAVSERLRRGVRTLVQRELFE